MNGPYFDGIVKFQDQGVVIVKCGKLPDDDAALPGRIIRIPLLGDHQAVDLLIALFLYFFELDSHHFQG